ncbi:hypothetical protein HYU07_06750 [Candidatus Woesearchaeota archaeon]|nr:hypothetical protein [Candidatus Woesearchaeota archaeon]
MSRLDWRFVDNVVNAEDLEHKELIEKVNEVNETTDLMITTYWFHCVEDELSKEARRREGEEGILEIARIYELHRNNLVKERLKQEHESAKGKLYDYVAIHAPSVVEGLSHREILKQIKYFMKTHPEWS